ncbi:MAG: sulfatase-like hydrolase/transferase [Opitutaceae bacterium]|nr:sulfatase-like hydrolase/transferase [Opitutaceae bacterium]
MPLLLLLIAPLLRAAERTVKPNILFILADDLGWSDLGCYGNKDIKTPNLNRLAQTGALFTQFYAAAPVCSPSRAAFFTGQYPARLRIHSHFAGIKENVARAMPQFLDPATPNIAGLLRSAGYATCHVGKWHLRNNVSQLADEEPIDERGQGPTPASYGFDFVGSGEPWGAAGPKDQPYYRAKSTERLVDETIRFIREHRDQPFYAQLWTLVPHARLNPTPAQLQPYAHLHPGGPDFPHASAREIYYASVTDLDTQLGRLLAVLEELGIAKDTLVIFSSDNGPEDIHVLNAGHSGVGSANPFRGRKRSLYEGGIRVPLLVRWPTRIEAGRIDEQSVVAAIDLLPTLCSVAGVTAPQLPAIDGEDMSDLLLKGPRPRQRPLFWETRYATSGEAIHQSPHLAIRDGGWKLLTNRDGSRTELYHLEEDPLEVDNLAANRKDLTEDMRKQLLDWSRTLPPGPIAPATGRLRHPWPEKPAARPAATPPR